MSKLWDAQESK